MPGPDFSSHPDGGSGQELPNPLNGIYVTLDGTRFDCEGRISLLDRGELAMLAMSHADITSVAGIAGMTQFLQLALGQAQYLAFKAHTYERRTPPERIMEVVHYLQVTVAETVEEMTGRPTTPPPSSSAGQAETAGSTSSPPRGGPARVLRMKLTETGGDVVEEADARREALEALDGELGYAAPPPPGTGPPADMPPADAPVDPEFREAMTG